MLRRLVAIVLAVALPASASAGPLTAAAERAGRELGRAQADVETQSRGRFWTGIAAIAGGATLATLGALELGDDETGPDDGEDFDDSDDGEDSDGWGNNAMIGGGIAAAAVGTWLILTGKSSGPVVSARPGSVSVQHRVRF